jgi:hypothetical protein
MYMCIMDKRQMSSVTNCSKEYINGLSGVIKYHEQLKAIRYAAKWYLFLYICVTVRNDVKQTKWRMSHDVLVYLALKLLAMMVSR